MAEDSPFPAVSVSTARKTRRSVAVAWVLRLLSLTRDLRQACAESAAAAHLFSIAREPDACTLHTIHKHGARVRSLKSEQMECNEMGFDLC